MKKLLEIKTDCLNIVKRIKSIDKGYFVLYDIMKNAYELHHKEQMKNSYCLTFPFDCLDERAVLYTQQTRVQNSEQLFIEMEKDNLKLEKTKVKQIFSDFEEKIYDS